MQAGAGQVSYDVLNFLCVHKRCVIGMCLTMDDASFEIVSRDSAEFSKVQLDSPPYLQSVA